jgi:hypothetical protein
MLTYNYDGKDDVTSSIDNIVQVLLKGGMSFDDIDPIRCGN